jgi:hypothetical protein
MPGHALSDDVVVLDDENLRHLPGIMTGARPGAGAAAVNFL